MYDDLIVEMYKYNKIKDFCKQCMYSNIKANNFFILNLENKTIFAVIDGSPVYMVTLTPTKPINTNIKGNGITTNL